MPLRPNLIQIWKHMFKRWWNSGLNTCQGMLEQLREMTQRWLTSKHVCASHWACGSQARIADAQSEDQTDLTARDWIFPKDAQIFLTNISRIFLTNITWQLESEYFPKMSLICKLVDPKVFPLQLFDLTLVPQERFGGITFTSENGRQTCQLANSNQCWMQSTWKYYKYDILTYKREDGMKVTLLLHNF